MGAQGPNGSDGDLIGLKGARGMCGEPGDVGELGDAGEVGVEGNVGLPGPQGPAVSIYVYVCVECITPLLHGGGLFHIKRRDYLYANPGYIPSIKAAANYR